MLVEGILGASVGLVNEGVGAVAGMTEGTEVDGIVGASVGLVNEVVGAVAGLTELLKHRPQN